MSVYPTRRKEEAEESFDIVPVSSQNDPFPLDNAFTAATFLFSWLMFFLYLVLRAKTTWHMSEAYDAACLAMWPNTVMEFMVIIPDFFSVWEMFIYLGFGRKPPRRPRLYLQGNRAPLVDVCITCCGEDVTVIMDTVAATASQDYPSEKFRVFLLDDGQDESLRQAVQSFNENRPPHCPNVVYLSRTKTPGVHHYFKSGNIRFGLEQTARLETTAEFFAALDVDMIPDRDWLRRMVPHVVRNPRAVMAIPPQRFYNTPLGDPLGQNTNVFAKIAEPMHDSVGSSICTGSGYVLRRAALDDIGGYPLAEAGEDILCSYLLVGHGWEMIFVDEEVQFGLVPSSLAAWFKQRARWTDGNILVFRKLGWFLPGLDPTPRRTALQRAIGISHVLKTYMALPNTVMILLLPWALWPVQQAQDTGPRTHIVTTQFTLQVLYLAAVVTQKFSMRRIYHSVGMKAANLQKANRFWNTPLNFTRIIRSWIPGCAIKFAVTGTILSGVNERSAQGRKGMWQRVLAPAVWIYIIWILYALAPVIARVKYHVSLGIWSETSVAPLVPPHPAAAVALFSAVMKFSLPLQYMVNPPTVPDHHRDLLEKGPDGVYRVPEDRRRTAPAQNAISWKDVVEVLIIAAVCRL